MIHKGEEPLGKMAARERISGPEILLMGVQVHRLPGILFDGLKL